MLLDLELASKKDVLQFLSERVSEKCGLRAGECRQALASRERNHLGRPRLAGHVPTGDSGPASRAGSTLTQVEFLAAGCEPAAKYSMRNGFHGNPNDAADIEKYKGASHASLRPVASDMARHTASPAIAAAAYGRCSPGCTRRSPLAAFHTAQTSSAGTPSTTAPTSNSTP